MRGYIVLDKEICRGCGFCVHFCAKAALENSHSEFIAGGGSLPVLSYPERCTGCGICGWMCPAAAIEVFKYAQV